MQFGSRAIYKRPEPCSGLMPGKRKYYANDVNDGKENKKSNKPTAQVLYTMLLVL